VSAELSPRAAANKEDREGEAEENSEMTAAPHEVANAVSDYRDQYKLRWLEAVGPYKFSYVPYEAELLPGCYAFYGDTENLLYIGKAPRCFKTRINEHRLCLQKQNAEWRKLIVWLQLFPVEHWWEAASMEDFLIYRFQPPHCKHGRDRGPPVLPF
jgi:hypothetical protein